MNSELAKNELRSLIRIRYGKPIDSQKSFEELAGLTNLSVQTLRRFYKKIEPHHKPSITTLSLLAKFVGFQDWTSFLQHLESEKSVSEHDKIAIEHMAVFFKNGNKYNTDYFQKTSTVDTLNDYAKIIYSSKENLEYFYKLHQNNNWATDYILGWIPNYNFYGQEWFRKILFDKSQKTKISHVKLSQANFLHLGSFLSESDFDFSENFEQLKSYYSEYQKDFGYMPYHEMRFCTILLIEAKRKNAPLEDIVSEYLKNLKLQNYPKTNYQELLIFFCNTLFWLQEYKLAFDIIQSAKSYLKTSRKQNHLHFYGMNMAFVKTTFALIYLANNKQIEEFEIENADVNDDANLLYHDYIQVMYLSKCILSNNGLKQKKSLFSELKTVVEKTNYSQIYNVLESLDAKFPKYCT